MGNYCCPRDTETAKIDSTLRQAARDGSDVIKLLFLGAGGSGKSTLFRQLRLLHGNGLKEDERMNYRSSIYTNIVDGMKTLLEGNAALVGDDDSDSGAGEVQLLSIASCDEKLAEYITRLDDAAPITVECAEYFKKAWKDKGMQQTWAERSKLQVQDSLKYFMENIDRIAKEGYIPSKDDVMHVRIRTTGIVEEKLEMENRPFQIMDVGGQRSERRKWMNCFADVTGLIFVASLTAYNQFLYEDENVNRLEESLQVFGKLLNDDSTFDEACIVLFLNKSDLFKEMCKKTPISKCIPEYKGDETEEAQFEFIKSLYMGKLKKKPLKKGKEAVARKVFTHKTCATNTDQIKIIFDAVNQHVIKRALIKAGLLPPDAL